MLLEPNGAANGYIELHGSAEQLAAVRSDEEFERTLVDASLIVEDLRLVEGVTEQALARQVSLFRRPWRACHRWRRSSVGAATAPGG